jgi:hypothetical protein
VQRETERSEDSATRETEGGHAERWATGQLARRILVAMANTGPHTYSGMLAGFVRQEGNSSTFVRIIPIEGGSRRAVRTCGTWANPQNDPLSKWGKAMTRLVRMARLLVAFYLLPGHEMTDTEAHLWHPWLRINRLLRAMLHTRWSAEAQVRVEFTRAVALRSEIRRAAWFNN